MFLQLDLESPFHIPGQNCFRAGRQPRVIVCLMGSDGIGCCGLSLAALEGGLGGCSVVGSRGFLALW